MKDCRKNRPASIVGSWIPKGWLSEAVLIWLTTSGLTPTITSSCLTFLLRLKRSGPQPSSAYRGNLKPLPDPSLRLWERITRSRSSLRYPIRPLNLSVQQKKPTAGQEVEPFSQVGVHLIPSP